MWTETKELTPEEKLSNALAEASYQRGRADGMREMWELLKGIEKDRPCLPR